MEHVRIRHSNPKNIDHSSKVALRSRDSHLSCVGFYSAGIAILFFTVSALELSGQAVVLHRFESPTPDPKLENVLYLAAGVALLHAGLSSTRQTDGEDYILSTSYREAAGRARITYSLLGADSHAGPLAAETIEVPVEPGLDERIAAAMRGLLKTAGIRPSPSPNARIEDLLPAISSGGAGGVRSTGSGLPPATPEPAVPPPVEPPPGELPSVPLNPPESVAAAEPATEGWSAPDASPPLPASPPVPSVPVQPGASPAGRGPKVRFDASISAAGVLFFGQLTEFVHYGAGGVVTAGIAFPGRSVTTTVAAEISAVRGFNDVNVSGGPLYLLTVGPTIRVGSAIGGPAQFAGGVSGGAAMVTVAAPAGTLVKTVPYSAASASALFSIGGGFSLGGEVRFIVVFDQSALIMAAAPAVTLRVEM